MIVKFVFTNLTYRNLSLLYVIIKLKCSTQIKKNFLEYLSMYYRE